MVCGLKYPSAPFAASFGSYGYGNNFSSFGFPYNVSQLSSQYSPQYTPFAGFNFAQSFGSGCGCQRNL